MMSILLRRLLVATGNPHKLQEFRALLPPAIEIIGLVDVAASLPTETGKTFATIADGKARAAAKASGMVTLADDSGLEVDALGGAPGVRSARFAGEGATDALNRAKLVAALSNTPDGERGARFVCALSLSLPDRIVGRSQGTCSGTIGHRGVGGYGFGYDPLFLLPDGRSMAELTQHEKNRLSHRGVAVRALLPLIIREIEL